MECACDLKLITFYRHRSELLCAKCSDNVIIHNEVLLDCIVCTWGIASV